MSQCNVCLSGKQLPQFICGQIRPVWGTITYSFQRTSERDEKEHFPALSGLREEKH